MTPGSAAVATKRSWTDRPDEPKNRLSMLLFFGMSALLLFVILIWSLGILWMQTEQKTFVATLSILRYGKGIPAPLYGVWDLGAMGKDLEKNGLKPWLPLINSAASKLDNKADVEATVAEWVDELKKKGALSKDTILIQLRCHAAVTREATDQWQCGLYIQDADDRPYPVGEFMQLLLKKIPVKNIVLVADVCDLKSAPHLGWIVNPIATYFMKACKELKSTPDGVGKNLWIICAADDAQAAYYSTLRKKTLFQEACEKGFEGFTAKQDLSLAAYFEAIYWHCHGSSGRHQTPRMIHANTGKDCFPSDQVSWQKANQVLLSQNQGKKGPKEADKDKKKDNDSSPKEKATEPKSANAERPADQDSIRLASMRQESEARTKDKPSTTEAGKSGKGEDKLDTEKLDTDERFRFWQLRDKISNRGDGVNGQMLNWSPNDFAPLLWRRLQSETASKDYDATFNRNELVKYEDNCNALSALAKALAEGVAVTQLEYSNQSQVDGFELCRTWNEFLKLKTRLQWDNEFLLSESNWKTTRREYRIYIDSISELPFWKELKAEFPELRKSYSSLVDILKNARDKLPRDQNASVLDSSINLQLSEATKFIKDLKSLLSTRIKNLLRDENKRLPWLVERDFQILLSSPLIPYLERKSLVEVLQKKEADNVKVGAKDNLEFSNLYRRESIGIPDSSLSEIVNYCKDLTDIAYLFLGHDDALKLLPLPSDLSGFLNWGRAYRSSMKPVSADVVSTDITRTWHHQSLIELGFPQMQTSLGGSYLNATIVVSPKSPKSILLSASEVKKSEVMKAVNFSAGESEASIDIVIEHFDGTHVDECQVSCSTNQEVRGLSISVDQAPLPMKQPMTVRPVSKTFKLTCRLNADIPLPNDAKMVIEVSDSKNKESSVLSVPLLRNASRIELVVKRADSTTPLVSNSESQFKLEAPAINGAVTRFSFALRNKLPSPRKVQLKVYAWPTLEEPKTGPYSDAYLLALSTPEIELPGSRGIGASQVEVDLKLSERTTKLLENVQASDSQLVFQIVEFENDPSANAPTKSKEKGKPTLYYGRLVPTLPLSELKIERESVKANEKMRINFEAPTKLWNNYGLKTLPIKIQGAITVNGQKINEENETVELQRDSSKSFIGPVMEEQKHFRFSLNIGGYPRAVVYKADPNESKMYEISESQVAIKQVLATPESGKPVRVEQQKGRYVILNRIENENVRFKEIEIETVLDFDASNGPAYFEFSTRESVDQERGVELKYDRWHEPILSVPEDGTLGVGFNTNELKIRQKIENIPEGVYIAKIRTGDKTAKAEFIFDETPPTRSSVVWRDNSKKWSSKIDGPKTRLYQGQTVQIGIEAVDKLSGFKSATFAIAEEPDTFSPIHSVLNKPMPVETGRDGEKITFNLSSAHELISKKPAGTFYIVAKTEDYAGNVQVINTPLEVEWIAEPLPKQQP